MNMVHFGWIPFAGDRHLLCLAPIHHEVGQLVPLHPQYDLAMLPRHGLEVCEVEPHSLEHISAHSVEVHRVNIIDLCDADRLEAVIALVQPLHYHLGLTRAHHPLVLVPGVLLRLMGGLRCSGGFVWSVALTFVGFCVGF